MADDADASTTTEERVEETPAQRGDTDADDGYSWGGRLSPENLVSWIDPETYPLPEFGEDPREHGSRVPVEIEREYPVEPDRVLAVGLVLLLVGMAGSVALSLVGVSIPPPIQSGITAGLWVFAVLYLVAAVVWLFNLALGWQSGEPPIEYGADDVQVRILTVDATGTVQRTIDHLPDSLTDRHVIAESDIDVTGATVHVVPESFECVATNKGRALEWARRNVPCDREYVLYLDEDTLVTEFDGLPDADLVQFREWPMKTDSWWTYWAEILRMGFQLEQLGYAEAKIPLYSWGGGLAVRKSVEDTITWDFDTLIEDTVFMWFAVENGASFEVVETRFRNQSPLSLTEMFDQRRRWLVGTIRSEEYLPLGHQILLTVRNVVWGFSPILLVLTFPLAVSPLELPILEPLRAVTWVLLVLAAVWVVAGVRYYDYRAQALPVLVLSPLVIFLHAVGALWGFLFPPQTFHTTPKSADTDSTE
jgi:hypothetical protein